MNSIEETYGALLFFRKDGQPSTTYPLSEGKITIGSSRDADIRLKMNDKRLEEVHCIIEVNDVGIATLFNKSVVEPVKINAISIRKNRILKHDDKIEFVGKKFMYLSGNSSNKDSDKNEKTAKKNRSTPSQKRHSSTLLTLKGGRKSPSFKTRIPVQVRPSTSRSYASTSSDFTVTYENESGKRSILDRSKTTSKVIVSKADRSPSSKKRRLSFGDQPKKYGKTPKMSTRNILLSKNIISTITEEEKSTSPKPSALKTKLDTSCKQNDEWDQSLDSNDLCSEDLINLNFSSNSSVSPVSSSSRHSTSSSPKNSPSRKSLHLPEDRISKSRNSLLRKCLQNNQDKSLRKSKGSLRKSKTGEINEQFPSEESPISIKSSRYSSRKSKTLEVNEEEQLGEQILSEDSKKQTPRQSINDSKTVTSAGGSVAKTESRTSSGITNRRQSLIERFSSKYESPVSNKSSRHSIKKSGQRDEEYETQSSSEELVLVPEYNSPNKSLRKSRQSLNENKTPRSMSKKNQIAGIKDEENKESSVLDEFESQSPNTSARGRQSMSIIGKQGKHSEEQLLLSESESSKQRKRLKSHSIIDKDESHEDPLRGLSVNLSHLQTPNGEVCKERRSSVRKMSPLNTPIRTPRRSSIRTSDRPSGNTEILRSNEELVNVSATGTTKETPLQRRSTISKKITSVEKGYGLNVDEDIGELSSREESLLLNVSPSSEKALTVPEEMRSFISKSNKLSYTDNEEQSSSEECFVLNISPMSTKETSMQKTPKGTISSVKTRQSSQSNREEHIGESFKLDTSALSSPNKMSKQTPATTPKETRTSLRNSRRSSIRNSNRFTRGDKNKELPSSNHLNQDEEIFEESVSEESFVLNISPGTSPTETSMQKTPKETVSSVKTRKRSKSNREEQVGEPSRLAESFKLDTSALISPKQTPATTPKETRTSLRKSRVSSVRNSNRLPRADENKGLLSPSNNLDQDEDVSEESGSEESFVLNISPATSPEETCRTPKETEISMNPSKGRISSVRNSDMLNTDEEDIEICSLVPITSMEKRSSVRKSGKLNRDVNISQVSSSEECLDSESNKSKELSVEICSMTTPKQESSMRTPTKRLSSVGKNNKLNEDVDSVKLRPSQIQNVAAVNRRSSVRKSKSVRDEEIGELSVSNVFAMNTPKETSVQRRLTTTPKELVKSLRISSESRSLVRNSSRLDREEVDDVSSSEESLVQNVSATNRRSSVKRNISIKDGEVRELSLGVSVMNTPRETSIRRCLTTPNDLVTSVRKANESKSSVRKSNRINREEEIDISGEECLDISISTSDSSIEKSTHRPPTTPKERRGSSVRESTESITDEEIEEVSSSEDSLVLPVNESIKRAVQEQSPITKRSIKKNKNQSPIRDSFVFSVSNFKNSTPIPSTHKNNIANETFQYSNYSSQDESDSSVESPQDRITPKLRHPSVRKSHLNTQDEISEIETSINKSSRSRTSSIRRSNKNVSPSKVDKAPLTHSKQNISVITLNDSIELTPENNSSVIIINTSLEMTRKSSHKRLSKTLNSTLQDDVELTTPKSAIKGRRPKSLPYNPLIEDITPVTPLGKSKNDSGFKTPLNTPGLFENIKKSVLRSRSRSQKSGANLTEELVKTEPKRGVKRPLVDESCVKSSKRRKLVGMRAGTSESFDTSQEAGDRSFESFLTDDVLTDISEQSVTQNTPKHFSDLTDKPVITHPQIRSSMEPKGRKSKSLRESSHSMRLSSHGSTEGSSRDEISRTNSSSSELNDNVFDTANDLRLRRSSRRSSVRSQTTKDNDSPAGMPRTPKNDLSDVAGLKKLLKSPQNEVTNVPNLKQLTSPRDDPTNITGVKKLINAPKQRRSPENDLRQIPNLRKLFSPKQQISPKNDLSDVAGVKKLLSTPNEIKSPKNDLRNVPNLRRLMSPKVQNSPKNDLDDVKGVKKLFSTPKSQKSPKNDLTNVPNLRRIMSPKQQNTPRDDLKDVHGLKEMMATPRESKERHNEMGENIFNVSGVQRLSIESDIENNEELFDKLFSKKPIKTYRGKSLSPASRKARMYDDNKRKTMGDIPFTSPRVEKWVEDQAVIKLNQIEDVHADESSEKTRGTPAKGAITDDQEGLRRRRGRRTVKSPAIEKGLISDELTGKVSRARAVRGNKRKLQEIPTDHMVDSKEDEVNSTSELEFKLPHVTRGRTKKAPQDEIDPITEVHSTTNDMKSSSPKRAKFRSKSESNVKAAKKEEMHPKLGRGENMKVVKEEEEAMGPVITKRTRSRKQNVMETEQEHLAIEEKQTTVVAKKTRGRKQPVVLVSESKPDLSSEETSHIDHQSDSEIEISKVEKDSKAGKRKVGRNTKKVAGKETENEENVKAVNEEQITTKRTRGRKALPSNSDSTSESTTQIVHDVEITKAEKDSKAGKRAVGRNKTKVAVNATEGEGEVKVADRRVSMIAKRTRGCKQNLMVTTESKSETVPEETEEIVDQNHAVEISKGKTDRKAGKRKVGKNKTKIAVNETEGEGEVEVINEEKQATPIIAKKTRSRKRNVEALEPESSKEMAQTVHKSDEIETSEVQKAGKKRAGRNKERVLEEKETQSDEQKGAKSVKTTRGRKRLATHEDNEDEEKVIEVKRSKETAEEEIRNMDEEERVLTKPTRGRKAIEKAKLVEESPVDSPRTARAKRGNFNKYGSDFLTEQGTKGENKGKKTVRFEENEQSSGRKGKGKNVANTEVVEEGTIRKSRRTRK